jgi:O-antigen/teichoic acid export membrane protein
LGQPGEDGVIPRLRALWQDELLRNIIANSSYLFSSNSASIVLSMVQGIFAARLLGPESYGLLAATIIPFVSTINRLTSFRMSEVVVKYLGQYLEKGQLADAAAMVRGVSLLDLLASIFGFLLLVILAPLAANFLAKDPLSVPFFITYGVIILTNANFETATGVLQVRNRFGSIAAVNLAQSVLTAAIILAAYLAGWGLFQVLLAYLLGKSLAGIATSILSFQELRRALGAGWWRTPLNRIPHWGGIGRFAISTNLNGTVNLIARDSETLWISLFRNPTEAGYFRIAQAVINLVMLPVQPFIGTTYREISNTVARFEWRQTKDLLRKVSALAGVWTAAAAVGLLVLGGWLIGLLYGPEYAPAYPAVLILMIGYSFANILFWNRPLLLALGLPAYPLNVSAATGLVKTILGFLLVPAYGYLMEAVLLTGYFLVSISVIVRKGLQELNRRL